MFTVATVQYYFFFPVWEMPHCLINDQFRFPTFIVVSCHGKAIRSVKNNNNNNNKMQQNNLRQKSKQQQKLLNDFNFFLMPVNLYNLRCGRR